MSPLPPSFLEDFFAGHDIIWYRILLWSVGVSFPSCASANFLCTPSLAAVGAECEKGKAFMLCKDCAAVAKTLACYQCCLVRNSEQITIWSARKRINSNPARPRTELEVIQSGRGMNNVLFKGPEQICGSQTLALMGDSVSPLVKGWVIQQDANSPGGFSQDL